MPNPFRFTAFAIAGLVVTNLITSCETTANLEKCKIVEIEDAEVEIHLLGDSDIEGGEVEAVCGDKIVDITWSEFNRKLKLNPEKYKNNVSQFSSEFTCLINEKNKKKVLACSSPKVNNNEMIDVKYTLDD